MKTCIKILAPVFLLLAFAPADDIKKNAINWIKEVNENYRKLEAISFDTEYTVYKGHDSQAAYETTTAHVKRKGTTFYNQRMNGFEAIQNAEIMLVREDSSRRIIVKSPTTLKQMEDGINIEVALKAAQTIEKIERGEKVSGYRLAFDKKKGMEFNKLELLFDEEKKVLCEIQAWYNTKINFTKDPNKGDEFVAPKLRIAFKNISVQSKISDDYFDTDKYVTKTKSGWVLKPAYKSYKLVDYTSSYKE